MHETLNRNLFYKWLCRFIILYRFVSKNIRKTSYKDPKVTFGWWHCRDIPRASNLNINAKFITVIIFSVVMVSQKTLLKVHSVILLTIVSSFLYWIYSNICFRDKFKIQILWKRLLRLREKVERLSIIANHFIQKNWRKVINSLCYWNFKQPDISISVEKLLFTKKKKKKKSKC